MSRIDRAHVGAKGNILSVGGLSVGHWTDLARGTGCTVVLFHRPSVCGVDIRGSAPGTRETALLDPTCLVERVDAIVLTGGSSLGLASASGVAFALREMGRGFPTSGGPVPIVPAAVVFDLAVGDRNAWPDEESGRAALAAASAYELEEGNVGVGTGATAGPGEGGTKTGLGSALASRGDLLVGAIVASNPVGCILDANGRTIAGPLRDGRLLDPGEVLTATPPGLSQNTLIGVVATNARLDKAMATKVAMMAHDGIARRVRPAHTMYDGDTLFSVSIGEGQAGANVSLVGDLAAEAVAGAILRSVALAAPLFGIPSARTLGVLH